MNSHLSLLPVDPESNAMADKAIMQNDEVAENHEKVLKRNPSLPNELLLLVVKAFAAHGDYDMLRSLRLVNKVFEDFATPFVFNTFAIPFGRDGAVKVMKEITTSTIGGHVKELVIPLACISNTCTSSDQTHPSKELLQRWTDELKEPLAGVLRSCSASLACISVNETCDWAPTDNEANNELLDAFYGLIANTIALAEVSVPSMKIETARLQDTASLWTKNLIENLEVIQVSLCNNTNYEEVPFEDLLRDKAALDQIFTNQLSEATKLRSIAVDCDKGSSSFSFALQGSESLGKSLRVLQLLDLNLEEAFAANIGNLQLLEALKMDNVLVNNDENDFRWFNVFHALRSIQSLKVVFFSFLNYVTYDPSQMPAREIGRGLYLDRIHEYPHRPLESLVQSDYDIFGMLVRDILDRRGVNDPEEIGGVNGRYMKDYLAPHVLHPRNWGLDD